MAYAPSSVVLDTVDHVLLVANDKGIGTKGIHSANSLQTSHGVSDYGHSSGPGHRQHHPHSEQAALETMTHQVFQNDHWDLFENVLAASGGNRFAKPVAIPAKIGDPSKIKHVFVIIRENRTYDQMLGDVTGGNGDPRSQSSATPRVSAS